MQYHSFIIILHRPFVSKRENQPYPPRGEGPFHARNMCIKSAMAIAHLVSLYKHHYTLFIAATPIVHTIFTAALILVYATISETNRERHELLSMQLSVLCRALSDLGHQYSNASRALDALLAVKRHWQGIILVGAGRKRSGTSHSSREVAPLRKWKRSAYASDPLSAPSAGVPVSTSAMRTIYDSEAGFDSRSADSASNDSPAFGELLNNYDGIVMSQ